MVKLLLQVTPSQRIVAHPPRSQRMLLHTHRGRNAACRTYSACRCSATRLDCIACGGKPTPSLGTARHGTARHGLLVRRTVTLQLSGARKRELCSAQVDAARVPKAKQPFALTAANASKRVSVASSCSHGCDRLCCVLRLSARQVASVNSTDARCSPYVGLPARSYLSLCAPKLFSSQQKWVTASKWLMYPEING